MPARPLSSSPRSAYPEGGELRPSSAALPQLARCAPVAASRAARDAREREHRRTPGARSLSCSLSSRVQKELDGCSGLGDRSPRGRVPAGNASAGRGRGRPCRHCLDGAENDAAVHGVACREARTVRPLVLALVLSSACGTTAAQRRASACGTARAACSAVEAACSLGER